MTEGGRIAPELVQRAREADLARVVGVDVRLKQKGRDHYEGLCPFHNEKTPSFHVYMSDRHFHCFGCGAHGDAIGYVMQRHRLSFAEAVADLTGGAWRSDARPAPGAAPRADHAALQAQREGERRGKVEWCRRTWRSCRPAVGTPVHGYLQSRGITLLPPPTLRFAPRLGERLYTDMQSAWWPAMVAPVQDRGGALVGVHVTFLEATGSKKAPIAAAKKMGGTMWGGAIRLAPAGPVLALAEGIETALSVMQATGLPCWAAGSLGNIAGAASPYGEDRPHPDRPDKRVPTEEPDLARPGFVPPAGVERLIILADADGDRWIGGALIERARQRYAEMGLDVRVAWAETGTDFNDMLQAWGAAPIKARVARATATVARRETLHLPPASMQKLMERGVVVERS